jgi:hypothetical protein
MFTHQTIRSFAQSLEQEKYGGADSNKEMEKSEALNKSSSKIKKSIQRIRNKTR